MADNTMPAAEAAVAEERELARYELAFHVLPTVAEGEVTRVVDALKAHIEKAGGELFGEEAPQRFDLAYEIIKHLEGKNRSFKSAYFGWLRFRLAPEAIDTLTAEVEDEKQLLRYLLIRLTRVEEENPFYFHEALETKKVSTVDLADDEAEATEVTEDEDKAEGETEAETTEDTEAGEETETSKNEDGESLDETDKKTEA